VETTESFLDSIRPKTLTVRPVLKFQHFALFVVIFGAGQALTQQTAPPDLSGVWKMNPEASHRSGDAARDMRVRIEQSGSDLTITLRGEEETVQKLHVGSQDNSNQIHGVPMKSAAQWEGKTLAVDSIATFPDGELRMSDLWSLSPDGITLTFKEHHQFGKEPPGNDTMVFDKQDPATWEPSGKPEMAEEKYKNIQVMKGMPASRLMPVMNMFTKSLGVQCSYCHVPGQFPSDDKPAKLTARNMLKMVHQINDENFPEHRQVSCWTCHRGSTKPETAPK
jgi:hypothetical protein